MLGFYHLIAFRFRKAVLKQIRAIIQGFCAGALECTAGGRCLRNGLESVECADDFKPGFFYFFDDTFGVA